MIFGFRSSKIGTFNVDNTSCNHCQELSTQQVSVFGRYFHVFWIPVFPLGRKSVSECVNCKKTIKKGAFSPELKAAFNEQKSSVKRPFWHYIGSLILAALIGLVIYIGSTAEPDSRSDLFNADLQMLTSNPSKQEDPVSYKIKQTFDAFVNEEINPSEFEYYSTAKEDKALVLVKIPDLKHVEKDARKEVIDMIESAIASEPSIKGKKLYIGVQGSFTMMVIKTPTYEANSRIASQSELYDYYGPKQLPPPSEE